MYRKEFANMEDIFNANNAVVVKKGKRYVPGNAYYESYSGQYTETDIPICEIAANMLAHATRKKRHNAKIAFFFVEINGEKWLLCLQTGSPLTKSDYHKMMKVGHTINEDYEPDMVENHMRGVGFNNALAYLSTTGHFIFLSKNKKNNEVLVLFNDKPSYETYSIYKTNYEAWAFDSYGEEFTTAMLIRIDEGKNRRGHASLDFSNVVTKLGGKFAFLLLMDSNVEITFDGTKVRPSLHATPMVMEDEKRFKDMCFDEDDASLRDAIKVSKFVYEGNTYIKGTLPCPVINGEIDFIQMVAEYRKGSSKTTGLTVYNYGFGVGHQGLKYFAKRGRKYIKNNLNFDTKKALSSTSDRKEANRYATYINLRPGANSHLYFTNDKNAIDLNSPTGKELRAFLDDTFGDVYREAFRKSGEAKDRSYADELIKIICGDDSNYIYLQEAVFYYAGSMRKIDGLILRITKDNEEKVNKFRNSKKKQYSLGPEDFSQSKPVNPIDNWSYDFYIVEYKAIDNRKTDCAAVDQTIRYAFQLGKAFNLDRHRMPIRLCGSALESDVESYIEDKKSDEGYRIATFCLNTHRE